MSETGKKIGIWIAIIIMIGAAFGSGYLLANKTEKYGQSEEYRTVVDGAGRTVLIPSHVERVVSLITGITQLIYTIHAEDKLVGVTQSLPYPTYYYVPESLNKTDVGSIANPNVEVIAGLEPDVVFTTEFFLQNAQPLIDAGIPVVAIRLDSISDILWNIRFIGSILDKTEEADGLADEMESNIKMIEDMVSSLNESRPTVYVEGSHGKTYGALSWCTEAIIKAGGVNIYGNSPIKMPIPSSEYIIEQNPSHIIYFVVAEDEEDFIKKAQDAINDLKNRPGWDSIDAVKNNRFCIIDNRAINFGPTYDDGVAAIAQFLHPELNLTSMIEFPQYVYSTQ